MTGDEDRDEVMLLRARVAVLEGALRRILEWDCLSPEPLVNLCSDLPWLKRLVEDALKEIRPI